MVADRHVGERSLEHAVLRRELVGDAEQHSLHQCRDVLPDEQVAQLRIAAVRVQVHHVGPVDWKPGAPQHMHLNGDVREVLRLQAVRRLDLDQPVAARAPLQDIHDGVGLVCEERRLVDPSGNVFPRLAADFVPLIEDVAQGGVRHELRRVRLVHAPPQLFVTLQTGEEARLGEAERLRRHIQQ